MTGIAWMLYLIGSRAQGLNCICVGPCQSLMVILNQSAFSIMVWVSWPTRGHANKSPFKPLSVVLFICGDLVLGAHSGLNYTYKVVQCTNNHHETVVTPLGSELCNIASWSYSNKKYCWWHILGHFRANNVLKLNLTIYFFLSLLKKRGWLGVK